MNNLISIFLAALLVIILGLFLMNNVMHIGIHWGHDHGDMGTISEHEDDAVEDYEIYPGDVVKKIKNGEKIVLLDVRTPEEYSEVHLENSLLLPVGELSANTLNNIGLGESAKDEEIIIYCRSGSRSKQAYDIMNSLGYKNIKSISGGIVHWQEDNYPFTEIGEYENKIFSPDGKSASGPKISFDRTSHDFGDVPQSKGILETTFEVINNGDSALEIGELSTSCGCTTAKISNKNIQPKETAILTVNFDPNFHDEPAGKLIRTIFIPTNDINNPEVEVKIMVDILEGE